VGRDEGYRDPRSLAGAHVERRLQVVPTDHVEPEVAGDDERIVPASSTVDTYLVMPHPRLDFTVVEAWRDPQRELHISPHPFDEAQEPATRLHALIAFSEEAIEEPGLTAAVSERRFDHEGAFDVASEQGSLAVRGND
jgi:hypothetical protein